MDTLIRLHRSALFGPVIRLLGLPNPTELARESGPYSSDVFRSKTVLVETAAGAMAAAPLMAALREAGATPLASLADAAGKPVDVLVFDGMACHELDGLRALYDTFHPAMRQIARNGRVLLLIPAPAAAATPAARAMSRGMEGFVRAIAKELGKRGVTANGLLVEANAGDRLAAAIRYFGGPQSAYVTGQIVGVSALAAAPAATPIARALAGQTALVTGAARGIGLAIAERLAQEGAHVVAVDVPGAADALSEVCFRIGGTALALDITSAEAPGKIAAALQVRGGVHIVVHNAGVTRDRTLARMDASQWQLVMDINLAAIMRIDEALLAGGVLCDHGRVVCLSSISGIAGNFGQTNYATSKAALIGYVAAQAPRHAARGLTFNAVAPGFIETAMTKKVPLVTRELGRRLNSLLQGGQPRDVAELVTFLATPGAYGVSGQTIRVCGQGLMGA